jgi:hypothetical protein
MMGYMLFDYLCNPFSDHLVYVCR